MSDIKTCFTGAAWYFINHGISISPSDKVAG